jgi:BA14K-like protein
MKAPFRHVAIAFALVAGTATASAQTVITREPYDTRTTLTRPLDLTPVQRTTVYRTIEPQGRGRGPIVRERIVTERYAPAPILSERVVAADADADYAYVARRPTFGERVIAQPAEASYAYVVGSRDASAPRYVYEYDGIRDAAYCQQRFRSYDLASGTYMGYDGMRHSCP